MVKNHVHPESPTLSYDDDNPTPSLIKPSSSILQIPPTKTKMKTASFDEDRNRKTSYIPTDPKYEQHVKEQRHMAVEEFKNKRFTLCFIFIIGIILMGIGGGLIWVAETYDLKDFYIIGPGLLIIGFIMVACGVILIIRGVMYIQHPFLRMKRQKNIVGGLQQDRAFIIDNYLIEQRLTAGMAPKTATESSESVDNAGNVEQSDSSDRRSKYIYESTPVSPEPNVSNVNTNGSNSNEPPSEGDNTHGGDKSPEIAEQEVVSSENSPDALIRSESSKRKSDKRKKKKKHKRKKSVGENDEIQDGNTEKVMSNTGEEHIIYLPSECNVESLEEKQSDENHENDSALKADDNGGETVELIKMAGKVPKPAVYVSPSLDQESTVTFF